MLEESEKMVVFQLKVYKYSEQIFGVDVMNANSDYFDFKEAKQSIVNELNDQCIECQCDCV